MRRLLGIIFLLEITIQVLAQDRPLDAGGQGPSMQKAVEAYDNLIGAQAMIFNGIKYVEFNGSSSGHPFFLSDDWDYGSVWYDGFGYHQIPILYDVVKDELILEHFDQNSGSVKIKVYQPKVSRFTISGHNFVRMTGDAKKVIARPGFYELIKEGNTQLVAKRRKGMNEEVSQSGVKLIFTVKDRYFIVREGSFFQVKGKASALKALQEKKSALKQFIRSANLRFAEDKEQDMAAMVDFYNKN